MTIRSFISGLLLSIVIAQLATALFVWAVPKAGNVDTINWVVSSLFILFSIVLFVGAKLAAPSENKSMFTGIVFGSIFSKIFLSVLILWVYKKVQNPSDSWFVAVFLIHYLVYTIFEVWFLLRLAKPINRSR
jgi:putative Ca2+/H+ antiporter (TMEM165/GDT1 family)